MITLTWILFVLAAAFASAAIVWQRKGATDSRWQAWLLGGLGIGSFAGGSYFAWLHPTHNHKPINVSNINILEDPSENLFVPGATSTYFVAAVVPSVDPPHRVFAYDHTLKSVAPLDVVLEAPPHCIAVIPPTQTVPEKLLLAVGAGVYCRSDQYKQCSPVFGLDPFQRAHAIRADCAGNVVLAQQSASQIAIYTIDTSVTPPSYSLVPGSAMPGSAVGDLQLSDPGFRRAAFTLENNASKQLYTWSGSGAPVVVTGLNPIMMNSGIKLLVATDMAPYVVEIVDVGRFEPRPCADGQQLDEVYGIASWNSADWVLAKFDGQTVLCKVAGGKLQKRQALGDLVQGMHKPRGFVPLGESLGLITGKHTFWNIVPKSSSYKAESELLKSVCVVATMWPCNGEALFVADFMGDQQEPAGIAVWSWWTEIH
jgi:hypothetical protein